MQERRSEIRMMCADMVEVYWRDENGKSRRTTGLLEDISSSGACLQLENSVLPGTQIEWRSPKCRFTARVKYCIYREIGYFVGLEFDAASRWSRKDYRPQHLLDPGRLLRSPRK